MDEKNLEKKQRKRKKKEGALEKTLTEEAAALEAFLFGGNAKSLLGSDADSDVEDLVSAGGPSREGKRSNAAVAIAGESREDDDQDGGLDGKEDMGRKAAWVDEEEEITGAVNLSRVNRLRKLRKEEGEELISAKDYISRLREQHRVLSRGVSWAQLPSENVSRKSVEGDSGTDEEEDLSADGVAVRNDRSSAFEAGVQTLLENRDLVVKGKTRLPQGLIELTPMRDGNSAEPSKAVVRSVEFHKNAQILMLAGFDKKLRFFQIDGKRNPKVQSVFLEDFPVHKAAFVSDGSRIVASGRRSYYYMYDLEAGRVERMSPLIGRTEKSMEAFEASPDGKHLAFLGNDGYILLCSLNSRQWIGNLKMNGSVTGVAFADDGRQLISVGGDGEIYHWDLRTRRCFHKGIDDGCTKSTALGVSRDSRLFATGSGSGVVNVYDRDSYVGGISRPVKSLENLVTNVDAIKFNHDAQILAITSRIKKNALRLVHIPSYTVFSNWPRVQTPLELIHCLDFSPGGGYLAVGNAAGRVLLYRLRHYDQA